MSSAHNQAPLTYPPTLDNITLTGVGNLERGSLQLPELGDVVEKLELDSGFGRQFVETLNSRDELEGVDVDGKGRRPIVRRDHWA